MHRVAPLLVLLAAACPNDDGSAKNGASASSQLSAELSPSEGHALLDEYVELLRQFVQYGSAEPFLAALDEHEQRAAKLATDGKIDTAFRQRHARVVEVTRITIAPAGEPAIRRKHTDTLAAFAREVGGANAEPLAPGGGLASVVPLIIEEVLRLHMLLDGTTDREATRTKYLSKLES